VAVFSCHSGESTYTPVPPMCGQIHRYASKPLNSVGNHWATDCIPVGCVDGTELCVRYAGPTQSKSPCVGGDLISAAPPGAH